MSDVCAVAVISVDSGQCNMLLLAWVITDQQQVPVTNPSISHSSYTQVLVYCWSHSLFMLWLLTTFFPHSFTVLLNKFFFRTVVDITCSSTYGWLRQNNFRPHCICIWKVEREGNCILLRLVVNKYLLQCWAAAVANQTTRRGINALAFKRIW